MLKKIKENLRRMIPERYIFSLKNMFGLFYIKSYSQEGEDVVLYKMFSYKKNGFYIDVGAHHPQHLSNTYLFYKRGWRGINIDALPNGMRSFKRKRPNDINLEIPITEEKGMMTYYAFAEPAYNGFSEELSLEREAAGVKLLYKKEMESNRLDAVLDKYMPANTQIDFMTIDVEGLDLQVLRSNNWEKYKPTVLVVELLGNTWESMLETEVSQYLNSLGYVPVSKCFHSCVFQYAPSQNFT